jgi:ribosomal protein L11 methylase PrmA
MPGPFPYTTPAPDCVSTFSSWTAWVLGSTEALGPAFDLVLANLPFQMQVAKGPEVARLSRSSIILSGFKDVQEKEVTENYTSWGWRLERRLTRDLWELEVPAEKSYTWVGLYFVI